ncbi:hypothetical protein P8868_18225 [Bacillus inaquosorum]|uniref:hypothetical protein n=1 Tax=Bacillus subtilis group TaxID=653685 RepID=UPI002281F67E|nr:MULTISPECIES: hypothetical protein [Bacillus subtilis group]MCY7811593.1 hypothetical protein [Bacillus spizizenii]MCY7827123.1 hypothetical protein [Bacillus spizizenii]MCY7839975.1 hypothetical protein [Bacillus spizizenii]MCY7880249.1 hypothetical protein [Bacillus spizizenii]MCY7889596.1 hypothetical protein [Bacillus spizizenii]
MYCVSKMTDHYGNYGESDSSYIRESLTGPFSDLFPDGQAFIELDEERGTYKVTGQDGGVIAFSTVTRSKKATDLEFSRQLFNAAADAACHYGVKNAYVVDGAVNIPVDEYEAELLKAEKEDDGE